MNHSNQATAVSGRYNGTEIGAIVAPQHPVPSAMDRLSVALNDLGVTADAVRMRLERVLGPVSTEQTKTDRALSGVPVAASGMTNDLHDQRQRIENITAGLQDVLNRLEV
jgi:hypothetical protein